jgi:hypothetical protein
MHLISQIHTEANTRVLLLWVLLQVECGVRYYLIRWWDFSPHWDSWEPEGCLDKPPKTYPWTLAVPEEVP